jgi:hypothetical protein
MPTGCVIAYSTYKQPNDATLPPRSAFGRADADHQVVCVNPAALLTPDAGPDTQLNSYFPTQRLIGGSPLLPGGFLEAEALGFRLPSHRTGFVRYAGQMRGQCLFREDASGTASWLQIRGGDDVIGPPSSGGLGLGLHVMDYNLALGDLVDVVGQQAAAWPRGA